MKNKIDGIYGLFRCSQFASLNIYNTVFLFCALGILSWGGTAQSQSTAPNDPLVMKVYPDGTKTVLRWSEIGKTMDQGEKHGGAPRIEPYQPAQDGIVPIGQTNQPVSNPKAAGESSPESSRAAVYKDIDEGSTAKRMTRPINFPDSTEQPYDWQKTARARREFLWWRNTTRMSLRTDPGRPILCHFPKHQFHQRASHGIQTHL